MRHSHLFTPFFSSAPTLAGASFIHFPAKKGGEDEVVVGMRFPLHFIESAGIAIDENREPAVLGEAKKMVAAVFSSAFNCTNIPQRKMMMKRDFALCNPFTLSKENHSFRSVGYLSFR